MTISKTLAASLASQPAKAAKGSKYGAKKTVVDGITFASKKEAKRYGELKLLERAGEITDLRLQPRYPLEVAGIKVATYVADFSYLDTRERHRPDGIAFFVVEDVKGMKTPMYRLKAKMFAAQYGFPIREV